MALKRKSSFSQSFSFFLFFVFVFLLFLFSSFFSFFFFFWPLLGHSLSRFAGMYLYISIFSYRQCMFSTNSKTMEDKKKVPLWPLKSWRNLWKPSMVGSVALKFWKCRKTALLDSLLYQHCLLILTPYDCFIK